MNARTILPDDGFHAGLRDLTRAAGTLLVVDVEQRRAEICAALCTDDALILSSDAPTAIGRSAVTEVIESWVAAGSAGERSWTIASFLDGDRPMLARGYELDLGGGAGTATERGRYLVTFRRVGERWRIDALVIFASDLD